MAKKLVLRTEGGCLQQINYYIFQRHGSYKPTTVLLTVSFGAEGCVVPGTVPPEDASAAEVGATDDAVLPAWIGVDVGVVLGGADLAQCDAAVVGRGASSTTIRDCGVWSVSHGRLQCVA